MADEEGVAVGVGDAEFAFGHVEGVGEVEGDAAAVVGEEVVWAAVERAAVVEARGEEV